MGRRIKNATLCPLQDSGKGAQPAQKTDTT